MLPGSLVRSSQFVVLAPSDHQTWLSYIKTSDQLFVCHRGRQKGNAVSKQRMAHWIVDAITLAYQAQGVRCPPRKHTRFTSQLGSFQRWADNLLNIAPHAGERAKAALPRTSELMYGQRREDVEKQAALGIRNLSDGGGGGGGGGGNAAKDALRFTQHAAAAAYLSQHRHSERETEANMCLIQY
ncbi:hypothetical protein QQF64_016452 [Cirrhinus molitorella]|uniref:Uncharacterized protein n=1 Tax=Cirrhinus molitorella TaxID=172907 RepID=A0ABR3LRZ5_9TELE